MANYNSCSAATLFSMDARCDSSIGGIKRILIIDKDKIVSVTQNADGEITAITTTTHTEGGETVSDKFEQWKFRRNTGSYTSTVTSDIAIGNSFATTEVSLQFSRSEAQKRLIIQNALNASCVVIVESLSGEAIYLGMDNDVVITNAVMQSGVNPTDLNGFTLTFQDVSKELPHFIASSLDLDTLV